MGEQQSNRPQALSTARSNSVALRINLKTGQVRQLDKTKGVVAFASAHRVGLPSGPA
jgi:hypothetical protein